ncbi:hypothetical protein NM688_g3476 [Phlebia brevispora]|uniref:Uncharacterized protein n=1 Tax=Phlebia brevispora TaxID=194682 RepID=A0ACC1T5K7_9APHY|nr:hypothetical protein NM688_g3476 [Phlebia brevispora]
MSTFAFTAELEGSYNYDDPSLMPRNDKGHMKFNMAYDPATSVVNALGSDSAGSFLIEGTFDGASLRFTKRYAAQQWEYVGTVVDDLSDNKFYSFTGFWGDGKRQKGTFSLKLSGMRIHEPVQSIPNLDGEWLGQYKYVNRPNRTDAPMRLSVAVTNGSTVRGRGKDECGSFSLDGFLTSDGGIIVATLRKRYLWNGSVFDYNGQVSSDGESVTGTWSQNGEVKGTFELDVKLQLQYRTHNGFFRLWVYESQRAMQPFYVRIIVKTSTSSIPVGVIKTDSDTVRLSDLRKQCEEPGRNYMSEQDVFLFPPRGSNTLFFPVSKIDESQFAISDHLLQDEAIYIQKAANTGWPDVLGDETGSLDLDGTVVGEPDTQCTPPVLVVPYVLYCSGMNYASSYTVTPLPDYLLRNDATFSVFARTPQIGKRVVLSVECPLHEKSSLLSIGIFRSSREIEVYTLAGESVRAGREITTKRNTWTHLALVWNITSRALLLFVDGQQIKHEFLFQQDKLEFISSMKDLHLVLGRAKINGLWEAAWDGEITEARVWQRILSEAEISAIAAAKPKPLNPNLPDNIKSYVLLSIRATLISAIANVDVDLADNKTLFCPIAKVDETEFFIKDYILDNTVFIQRPETTELAVTFKDETGSVDEDRTIAEEATSPRIAPVVVVSYELNCWGLWDPKSPELDRERVTSYTVTPLPEYFLRGDCTFSVFARTPQEGKRVVLSVESPFQDKSILYIGMSEGTREVEVYTSVTELIRAGPDITVGRDDWTHLALVWNITNRALLLFVNGQQVKQEYLNQPEGLDFIRGLKVLNLVLGRAKVDGHWEAGWDGQITTARAWRRALDDIEINALAAEIPRPLNPTLPRVWNDSKC